MVESARIVQVIQTVFWKGTGQEGDPLRRVLQFWTFEGKPIGEMEFGDRITLMNEEPEAAAPEPERK